MNQIPNPVVGMARPPRPVVDSKCWSPVVDVQAGESVGLKISKLKDENFKDSRTKVITRQIVDQKI